MKGFDWDSLNKFLFKWISIAFIVKIIGRIILHEVMNSEAKFGMQNKNKNSASVKIIYEDTIMSVKCHIKKANKTLTLCAQECNSVINENLKNSTGNYLSSKQSSDDLCIVDVDELILHPFRDFLALSLCIACYTLQRKMVLCKHEAVMRFHTT